MRILKTLGRLAQSLLLILLSVVLAANLYIMAAKSWSGNQNPTVFGWTWAVVLSGSMEPEIHLDDLIIYKAQSSYQIGDIITFENGSSLTTHRIVGETENGFITKGDANNTEDAYPVPQENIVGRVVTTVPNIGRVVSFLKTPMGMLCMVLMGFLMIEVSYLLDCCENRRKKGCE